MLNLKTMMSSLAPKRAAWEKLLRATRRLKTPESGGVVGAHLEEVRGFGSNPGNLQMFKYLPRLLPDDAALVVVLHGCTQTAAGYDLGAGWSTLADRYGFALLLPQQQRANNPNGCFNWFLPGDVERGRGEAHSIRQMVEKMIGDHGIDRRRVFITGLSAGGAMTSVMLACYPEVFAGGAIIAGLPYGAATNVQQAFESMFQCPTRPAREWGDLVRRAAPHQGPWPRISVWHGGADTTVIPANALEILKQWTDVHGLPLRPSAEGMVDGYPRAAWINGAGDEAIESYTIPHMAHGTPLATGAADGDCGTAGPFLLEVGISSSYHVAKFFGLAHARPVAAADLNKEIMAPDRPVAGAGWTPALPPAPAADLPSEQSAAPEDRAGAQRVDIGAVINKALTAAGLMKS